METQDIKGYAVLSPDPRGCSLSDMVQTRLGWNLFGMSSLFFSISPPTIFFKEIVISFSLPEKKKIRSLSHLNCGILIYGITETWEANATERRLYYSHFPREGSVATIQGHWGKHQGWSEAGESLGLSLSWGYCGKGRGLASMSRCSGLWPLAAWSWPWPWYE